MSFSCLNESGYIGSMMMRGRRAVSRMPSSRSNSQVRFCCAISRRCSLFARRDDHALHGLQLLIEEIAQPRQFLRRRTDRSRARSRRIGWCGRDSPIGPGRRRAGPAAMASCLLRCRWPPKGLRSLRSGLRSKFLRLPRLRPRAAPLRRISVWASLSAPSWPSSDLRFGFGGFVAASPSLLGGLVADFQIAQDRARQLGEAASDRASCFRA